MERCPGEPLAPEDSCMTIIDCDTRHLAAMQAIFNEAIANTTALYDYVPRSVEVMQQWLADKRASNYPILGAVTDDGELMGFASYGPFRMRPAYKYSIEHSIYVDTRYRGQGVARELMQRLIAAAEAQDYHMMIGGIDAANEASIQMHLRLGFSHCGTVRQAGFKFGRWLDLEFYQIILRTPANPVDG
jgi:L-amino acid N-acyltransferase